MDALHPSALARWLADVLGWVVTDEERGCSWISASGGFTERPCIVFNQVSEAKPAKNRLHVDVSPTGVDAETELERLLALGAVEVDVGQGHVPRIVLADPEGNEFCPLSRRIDP